MADKAANAGHKHNKSAWFKLNQKESINMITIEDKLVDNSNFTIASGFRGFHLYHNNTKIHVAITRMQIAHVGLHKFPHRMKLSLTNLCSKCNHSEILKHSLLYFPGYTQQRYKLLQKLQTGRFATLTGKIILDTHTACSNIRISLPCSGSLCNGDGSTVQAINTTPPRTKKNKRFGLGWDSRTSVPSQCGGIPHCPVTKSLGWGEMHEHRMGLVQLSPFRVEEDTREHWRCLPIPELIVWEGRHF